VANAAAYACTLPASRTIAWSARAFSIVPAIFLRECTTPSVAMMRSISNSPYIATRSTEKPSNAARNVSQRAVMIAQLSPA